VDASLPQKKITSLTGVRDDVSPKRIRIGIKHWHKILYYAIRVTAATVELPESFKTVVTIRTPLHRISFYKYQRLMSGRKSEGKKFWKLNSFLIYAPTDNEHVLHMGTIYNYVYTTVDACGWSLEGGWVPVHYASVPNRRRLDSKSVTVTAHHDEKIP